MESPATLFKVLTDAGPWAVAVVLAYVALLERKRGDRLEGVILVQIPRMTKAMNRMRWFIQGRQGPEDDEDDDDDKGGS